MTTVNVSDPTTDQTFKLLQGTPVVGESYDIGFPMARRKNHIFSPPIQGYQTVSLFIDVGGKRDWGLEREGKVLLYPFSAMLEGQ